MAGTIFFISDTHFFHENTITKFKRGDGSPLRDFSCVDEMNEHMIDRWNSVVQPHDKIYHLGDVSMHYGEKLEKLLRRLNGHKRLRVGNHDDIKQPSLTNAFEKIGLWRIFKAENFLCTHVPFDMSEFRKVENNVHGHIHWRCRKEPCYINVSVENVDYTPVSIDEIQKIIKRREK